MLKRIFFSLFILLVFSFFAIKLFYPLYIADEVIIPYAIHPFDICSKNPDLWHYIKITYIFTFIFSNLVFSNFIYTRFIKKIFNKSCSNNIKKNKKILSTSLSTNLNSSNLNLLIGFDSISNSNIYIPESGLYQNFLITGTIGSGKTSSAMYPFTEQLIKYNYSNPVSYTHLMDFSYNMHLLLLYILHYVFYQYQ